MLFTLCQSPLLNGANPVVENQRSLSENSIIRPKPRTKGGTEMLISDKNVKMRSKMPLGFLAESVAIGIASTSANRIAINPSSAVTGAREEITEATDCWVNNELPRWPCNAAQTQFQYRTKRGWLSPSVLFNCAIA